MVFANSVTRFRCSSGTSAEERAVGPGIKVSQNATKHRSGAPKFKPGAFWLQNYWISQPGTYVPGLSKLATFVIAIQ